MVAVAWTAQKRAERVTGASETTGTSGPERRRAAAPTPLRVHSVSELTQGALWARQRGALRCLPVGSGP